MRANWTHEEISHITQGYMKKTPIKIMARALNRSPGSVNKALSRLRVRQPRLGCVALVATPRRLKQKHISQDTCINQFTYLPMRQTKTWKSAQLTLWHPQKSTHEDNIWNARNWVTKNDLEQFLKQCHYKISLHDGPQTEAQMLLYANRQRILQGMPPFYIEGVTR